MTDEELQLLLRHCEGATDVGGAAKVNDLLRRDEEARAMLRSITMQVVALGENCATRASVGRPEAFSIGNRTRTAAWRTWLALAACLALLAGVAWVWNGRGRKVPGGTPIATSFSGPAMVTLAEATGTIWFREEQSSELQPAEAGALLPAGVILTEGSVSSALLRFADGSEVALAADTELAFTNDGRKSLGVRGGVVSAQVTPQPPGRPMVIRTATAELLVLGTVLTVTVEAERTRLDVEKGAVKMTRLADGQSVDVPQDFSATALSTPEENLTTNRRPSMPAAAWNESFENGLPRSWRLGRWTTEPGLDGRSSGFVRADIENAPAEDGMPPRKPNHIIGTTNAWIAGTEVLAELREESVLRMTLRKARVGGLYVIVCVRSLDGDRTSLRTDVLKIENPPGWNELRVGQWGEVMVRLNPYILRDGEHTRSVLSKGVFYIAVSTGDRDLGLEMKDIQLH